MNRVALFMTGIVLFVCLACNSGDDSGNQDRNDSDNESGITDGDNDDAVNGDTDLPPGVVQLNGSVEKGPFVLGSSITISPVDPDGNPTGQQFTTQTFNDMGEFSVNFEASGFVSLEGTGFYYNEVTGDLSGANLTLRAFYEIVNDGVQNAHLNLLTHLTYNRVKNLVQMGTPIADAIEQAEGELVSALPIGSENFTLDNPAIELTLQGGDTLQNAYLFAVSSVLSHAARLRSPASPDAALQELINGISADLAVDGVISQTTVQTLVEAQTLPMELDGNSSGQYLIPATVMADLEARFEELGSTAEIPNLNRVLDSDFDSVPNDDDNCWWIANTNQTDDNGNQIGDACDIVFKDSNTGLSWQNISTYHMDTFYTFDGEWEDAVNYCENLDFGGFDDWRMPSIDELRSLVAGCPNKQSDGICGLHNNCALNDAACIKDCNACEETETPYWKEGVLGTPIVWSKQISPHRGSSVNYWWFDFDIAKFQDGPIALESDSPNMFVRCVRGYSVHQEFVCNDGVDDDGDGKKDCEDSDCFAIPEDIGLCGNMFDLTGLNSAEFSQCREWIDCPVISYPCGECLGVWIYENCNEVCEEGHGDSAACRECMLGSFDTCLGSFVCDIETICMDGVDNDSDSLTDMQDPDCEILTDGLPDGDVDGDFDGDEDADEEGNLPTVSPVVEGNSATFFYVSTETVPNRIKVVGSFLHSPWNPSMGIVMTQIAANVWTATADDLGVGEHHYKFWYPENTWLADPLNPNEDGSQDHNSVFWITEGCESECSDVLGDYCFDTALLGQGNHEICDIFFSFSNWTWTIDNPDYDDCSFDILTSSENDSAPPEKRAEMRFCSFDNISIDLEDPAWILTDDDQGNLILSQPNYSGQVICSARLTKEACHDVPVDGDIDEVDQMDSFDEEPESNEEDIEPDGNSETEAEADEVHCTWDCSQFDRLFCPVSFDGTGCEALQRHFLLIEPDPENPCGFKVYMTMDEGITKRWLIDVPDCVVSGVELPGYAEENCTFTYGSMPINGIDVQCGEEELACSVRMEPEACH